MKPIFSPGQSEQPKLCTQTYDCIQYSNKPDPQKKSQKKSSKSAPIVEPVKWLNLSNTFQNSKLIQEHQKLQLIKDNIIVPIHLVHQH